MSHDLFSVLFYSISEAKNRALENSIVEICSLVIQQNVTYFFIKYKYAKINKIENIIPQFLFLNVIEFKRNICSSIF